MRGTVAWDRRVALRDSEAAALLALGPAGYAAIGPWVVRDERHDTGMRWSG